MSAARPPVAPGLHVVLGAGPVGRAVARELLGHPRTSVRLASRSGRAVDAALAADPRVEVLAADLADPEGTIAACRDAATVTFAAAPPYPRWPELFPALQENAIRGAAEAGAALVAVENLYGYGRTGALREADPLAATTRKGAVRAAMSARLFEAHREGRVRAAAGRASDLFGPGMAVSALGARVWPRLIAGRAVAWIGDPDAPHSFTYLPDFARALVRLGAEERAWGRAWHVPSPPDRSARAVISHAAGLIGRPAPRVRRVPKPVLRLMGLVSPTVREVAEMSYQFEAPLHMRADDCIAAFGEEATGWDEALRETLRAWGAASALAGRGEPLSGPGADAPA